MKLSKHGREHLGYHEAIGLGIGSYDFQQEDFVDGVVLTVEEAKRWMRILYDNAEHLDCLYECCKNDYFFLEEMSKRIERAEKGNEVE